MVVPGDILAKTYCLSGIPKSSATHYHSFSGVSLGQSLPKAEAAAAQPFGLHFLTIASYLALQCPRRPIMPLLVPECKFKFMFMEI